MANNTEKDRIPVDLDADIQHLLGHSPEKNTLKKTCSQFNLKKKSFHKTTEKNL